MVINSLQLLLKRDHMDAETQHSAVFPLDYCGATELYL